MAQEFLLGIGKFPAVVSRKGIDDASVAAVVVVVLKDLQGEHVGPHLTSSFPVVGRAEEAIVFVAAVQNGFNPKAGFCQHVFVVQHIGHVAVAA